jgi:cytochrome c oxidase subunit I+III
MDRHAVARRRAVNTPTLFIVGFLVTFTMGGLTGVMVAALPFNWQAHDSYFVVAHLHYVLIGGMVMPVFAALYYWMPVLHGHALGERCGRWVFALVFGGFHLAFFPLHIAGLRGMPRRIYTYDAGLGWEGPNLLSSAGARCSAPACCCSPSTSCERCAARVASTTTRGAPPRSNGCPPATTARAASAGRQPRSALAPPHPAAGGEGRPALAARHRDRLLETLVTTPRHARPDHVIVLPGPGWTPLVAAFGTAAFFILLTVKSVAPAFAFGVLALACVIAWLWRSDRPPAGPVQVADDTWLPVGAALARSPSWWATVVLLVVDFTVLASMAFAHLHLALLAPECPPAGAALPAWPQVSTAAAAFVISGGLLALTGHGLRARPPSRWHLVPLAAATATLAGAFALLLWSMAGARLDPTAHGWSATIAGLLGYLGFHLAVLAVAAPYLGARLWHRLVTPRARATFDNIALLWWGTCAQGVIVALLPHVVAALIVGPHAPPVAAPQGGACCGPAEPNPRKTLVELFHAGGVARRGGGEPG